MPLYQVFHNDDMIADNLTINEALQRIPAGSVLVSGNTKKTITKPDGGLEEVEEIKAVYKLTGSRGKITVIQI